MTRAQRSAFTLVEILIVVVIMAILAAAVIPQFTDSSTDAKASTALMNLHSLRSQIELYKAHHNGSRPSATLAELLTSTNASGAVGTGAAYPYGPYLQKIPVNPITGLNSVKAITSNPAVTGDVTVGGGGWLYNATTGRAFLDDETLFVE